MRACLLTTQLRVGSVAMEDAQSLLAGWPSQEMIPGSPKNKVESDKDVSIYPWPTHTGKAEKREGGREEGGRQENRLMLYQKPAA